MWMIVRYFEWGVTDANASLIVLKSPFPFWATVIFFALPVGLGRMPMLSLFSLGLLLLLLLLLCLCLSLLWRSLPSPLPCEDPVPRAVLRPGVPAVEGNVVSSSEVSATYFSHPSKVSVSVTGAPWKLPTLSAHTKANKTKNKTAQQAVDGLQLPILELQYNTCHHEFDRRKLWDNFNENRWIEACTRASIQTLVHSYLICAQTFADINGQNGKLSRTIVLHGSGE